MGEEDLSFGEMLRLFRGTAKLTQEDLADRSGLSVEAVSLLERGGRTAPRTSTVALLAEALGLSPAEHTAFVGAARRPTGTRTAPAGTPVADSLLAALPLDAVPDPGPLPPGSRMPIARNPLFVGRAHDLRRMALVLKDGGALVLGQVVAATGMGGLGKTQLAIEFVHRYGRYFAGGVFWLSFANPEEVPLQIASCGGIGFMELRPGFADLRLEDQLALVRGAWQGALPRLLVFDNCEDETLLARWRPPSGGSRVLVTARRASWDAALGVDTVEVDTLARAESLELLAKFRPDLAAGDPDLDRIAHELGDLPLALHLAGSYLARYREEVTGREYLTQLRGANPLGHPSLTDDDAINPSAPTKHMQGVGRSFTLSYGQLDRTDSVDTVALALLARAACFAPGEPIARELLLRALEEPAVACADLQRADALIRLEALGLLQRSSEGFRLHRLLAHFVQNAAGDPLAQLAVDRTLVCYTELALDRQPVVADLLAVASHLAHAASRPLQDAATAALHDALGRVLETSGDYVAAQPHLELALRVRERVLGADHPDTASSLDHLAMLLWDRGELAACQPLYERALEVRGRVLGAKHPDMATGLNGLGILMQARGDLAGARSFFERAVTVSEHALGSSDPRTAVALNNLAVLLRDQGDMAAARSLMERVLAIREQALGPDHPDTANILNDLGLLLSDLGDRSAARVLYERALAIRERVLGPDHPRTAQTLNNLARLLRDQGELSAARHHFERAVAIWEASMGPDHLLTAHGLHNLGRLLHELGEPAAARPLLERVLALRERVLGPNHPRTAQSLVSVAGLLHAEGELDAARPLLERALTIHELVLGDDHPLTAGSLHMLGLVLRDRGESRGARACLARAVAIRERALGLHHPDTELSRGGLEGLPPDP